MAPGGRRPAGDGVPASDGCALCGLPTPDPPVTGPDVEGTFCCVGCRAVATAVGTAEGVDRSAVRDRAATGGTPTASPDDRAEAFLRIDGMHCATCEAFVSLLGERTDGVHTVEASYATDTARVRYDPDRLDRADLEAALSGYGYAAHDRADPREPGRDDQTVQRLLVGGALAMLIMPWYLFFLYPSYVGIETGILTADMTTPVGLYLPMALIGLLAAGVVGYTGFPILRGAYVSLRTGRPNMDLLLSVAILSAYAYSTVALLSGSTHLYYDVAVAIVLVVTAGTHYEGRLKRAATSRLADLTATRVETAVRRGPDGTSERVPVEAVDPGDELLVRPGERIPLDGTVVSGTAAVDEAVLTGESLPTTRGPGDDVVGGSVATDGTLVVVVGDDAESTVDRLAALVWAVQTDRPGIQRFADRLAAVFVPAVLLLGGVVAGWRLLGGEPVAAATLAGLTVLVAACPCAMGLATPLAVAAGLRDALRRGLVVTNGALFELAPAADTVVFDKTGTLTTGEMAVRRVVGDGAAVTAAAAVETHAAHPAAAAIVEHARARADGGGVAGSPVPTATAVEVHPGAGVSGTVDGERVVAGHADLVERLAGPLPATLAAAVAEARAEGALPVVVARAGQPAAVVVVGDEPRPGWADVFDALADRDVVVLTGDEASATAPFRDHPAVTDVFAGVPPEGKVATVRRLRTQGTVAMVGDGTNDAPALSAADVGIALSGTAAAADAADVAIVDGGLESVPDVFALATNTRGRIRENVGWALGYNGVALPLAALGWLNPLLAALAMAASSVLVVTNSRRRLLP